MREARPDTNYVDGELPVDVELVSADSHFLEPPGIWSDWLPNRYQDRAPRLVDDGAGGDAWEYGSAIEPEPIGLSALPGREGSDLRPVGVSYSDAQPGTFDGNFRGVDQDRDGVAAEVVFPTSRVMAHFLNDPDRDFQLEGLRAYNRYMVEDFCAAAPSRLFPVAQLPSTGVTDAIGLLEWATDASCRAVVLPCWPSGGEHLSSLDSPFFAAAQASEIAVCIHAGLRSREERLLLREVSLLDKSEQKSSDWARLKPVEDVAPIALEYHHRLSNPGLGIGRAAAVLSSLLLSGLFDQFPRLRVALVETWVGWIPRLLEAVDDTWERNRKLMKIGLKRPPSSYWYSNMAATFIDDRSGIELRNLVGSHNMMWSSDYPHFCTKWPNSRLVASEALRGVPLEEARNILADNCREFFGLARSD